MNYYFHFLLPLMRYRFPYVGADLFKLSSSQASANTVRPWIWAGVSHCMPVYSRFCFLYLIIIVMDIHSSSITYTQ